MPVQGSFQLFAAIEGPGGAQAAARHQADAGPGQGGFGHAVGQHRLGANKAGNASHKKAEGQDAAGDGQRQPDAEPLAGAPPDGADIPLLAGGRKGVVPVGAPAPKAAGGAAGLPLLPAAVFPRTAGSRPLFLVGKRLLKGPGHLVHHAVQHGGDVVGHVAGLPAQLVPAALKAVAESVVDGGAQPVHADPQVPQLPFQLLLDGGLIPLLFVLLILIHDTPSNPRRAVPADNGRGHPQAVHRGAHDAAGVARPLAAGVEPRQLGADIVFPPLQPHRAGGACLQAGQNGLGRGVAGQFAVKGPQPGPQRAGQLRRQQAGMTPRS